MKILILNGSPNVNGCTARALKEVEDILNAEGIQTETIQVGRESIRGCLACRYCKTNNKCVLNDVVNVVAEKFENADGLLVGTPTYYAGSNGNLISLLDRLFYSTSFNKTMKVGAAVVSSRRGGSTSAFDEINKYFTICGMPIVSSTYWNEVHGNHPSEVEKDLEGLQTMRNLGRNMAFLVKSINLGKSKYGLPEKERNYYTSFHDKK